MSEYQYYEFHAIDRALTEEEQSYIASLSRRVVLTPNRAIFTYSYGDFPEKPMKILQRYFDAMLYLANWGSKQLAFRLPRTVIDSEMIEPYCFEDTVSAYVTKDSVILDISVFDEEGYGWVEGEGWLHSLSLLRQDILRGDFRVLYLAWLKAISLEQGSSDVGDEQEPPVPSNLQDLSPPLKKFVDFFEIDWDLITAAFEVSPKEEALSEREIEELITNLAERERNSFLLSLARGEPNIDVQLMRRLREISSERMGANIGSIPSRRRIADLFTLAQEIAKHREEKERQEAEEARVQRLNELSKKEPKLWEEIFVLIDRRQANTYDEAVKLLIQIRELAEYHRDMDKFRKQINQIYEQYRNRPSLIARLRQAGLLREGI